MKRLPGRFDAEPSIFADKELFKDWVFGAFNFFYEPRSRTHT